jgi:hypothetical protein
MLAEWRGPLALGKQGFHLGEAAFDVQKRGKQDLLVQWGQHVQRSTKKALGNVPEGFDLPLCPYPREIPSGRGH